MRKVEFNGKIYFYHGRNTQEALSKDGKSITVTKVALEDIETGATVLTDFDKIKFING